MNRSFSILFASSALLLASAAVYADDYVITLKDGQFSPQELVVPAGQKVKLILRNQDATAAEFESSELHREKVVAAKSEKFMFIGPLQAGSYKIFNDFHHATTSTITAK